MNNTPNSTDNLYAPGTRIVLTDHVYAVYLGSAGRGLHAVAVTDTLAPFYESTPADLETGAARFPNLRRARWTPRKVRPGTIVDTHERLVQIAREAREAQRRDREETERRERAERDAVRQLVDAVDRLPLDVQAYERNGSLHIFGRDKVAACELIAEALTGAAPRPGTVEAAPA